MAFHIAVLGDLHGRIYDALQLCLAWEKKHGITLDLILQCGDFGVWPFNHRIDKATKRHAVHDIRELGFSEFLQPSPKLDALFGALKANILFVPGNHEDFEYLRECANGWEKDTIYPIDAYRRLWRLKNGRAFELTKGKETIRIAGLGGIDNSTRKKRYSSDAYIDGKHADKLMHERFDIFISHDSPKDACVQGAGSPDVTRVLKARNPAYAFFAHYGKGPHDVKIPGCSTRIYRLNDVYHGHEPKQQSIGIITWHDKTKHEFCYVSKEKNSS